MPELYLGTIIIIIIDIHPHHIMLPAQMSLTFSLTPPYHSSLLQGAQGYIYSYYSSTNTFKGFLNELSNFNKLIYIRILQTDMT